MRAREISSIGCLMTALLLSPGATAQKYRGTPEQAVTVTLRARMFDLDGRLASVQETTVAFREDGSKVERTVFFTPDRVSGELTRETEAKHVRNYETGQTVSVFETFRTKLTAPLDSGPRQMTDPRPPGCGDPFGPLREPVEARETILGYTLMKVGHRNESQDGAVFSVEQWRAPALGCLVLRSRGSFTRDDGSVFGRSEEEAVSVVFGAPDSSLFEIPEDYTEQAEMLKAERATTFSWRRGDP